MKPSLRMVVSAASICNDEALRQYCCESLPEWDIHFLNDIERAEIGNYLQNVDALFVGKEPIHKGVLTNAKRLRFLCKYGVGLDNVSAEVLADPKINLIHAPGVNAASVAELTLMMMIGLSRNGFLSDRKLKQGDWFKNGGRSLSELKIGVIGVGHVGTAVARLLKSFGNNPFGVDLETLDTEICRQITYEQAVDSCDLLTFHVPLTAETRHMFSNAEVNRIKRGAYIVNTSRGAVLNQGDVANGLHSGKLGGCALDVYEEEPCVDSRLLAAPGFFGTAHIGGNSVSAKHGMVSQPIKHLKRHLDNFAK